MLEGCVEAAERVFNMPVRIGIPSDIVGLKDVVATPQYANGVGLLKYGIRMNRFRGQGKFGKTKPGIVSRLKRVFEEYL